MTPTPPLPPRPASFEENLQELEVLTQRLENLDDVPLDEAVDLYERAVTLVRTNKRILREETIKANTVNAFLRGERDSPT